MMLRALLPAVTLVALSFASPAGALEPDLDACPPLPLDEGDCGLAQGGVTLELLGACEIYMQSCGFRNDGWLVATACAEAPGDLVLTWEYLGSDEAAGVGLASLRETGDEACPYAASLAKPIGGGDVSATWECVTAQAIAVAPTPVGSASRTGCMTQ